MKTFHRLQLPQEEEATTQQDSTFSPEYFTLEEVRFLGRANSVVIADHTFKLH